MANGDDNDQSKATTTPSEPTVTIPAITQISELPPLPPPPKDLASKPVPAAAYQVSIATADQAFGKDFDKAKSDLVKAQGAYTAAQQTYALAVATYNSGLQTARATQISSYNDADSTFEKSC